MSAEVLPSRPPDHEWARAVLYRTHIPDIDNGVMVITDATRLSLGDPFCISCGSAYPPANGCQPVEDEPLGPIEEFVKLPANLTPLVGSRRGRTDPRSGRKG